MEHPNPGPGFVDWSDAVEWAIALHVGSIGWRKWKVHAAEDPYGQRPRIWMLQRII